MKQKKIKSVFLIFISIVIAIMIYGFESRMQVFESPFCHVQAQIECRVGTGIYYKDCATFIQYGDFKRIIGENPPAQPVDWINNETVKWCAS